MKQSAGILLYRIKGELQFLLAHPGGPYWKNKDNGWWTIPKGLAEEGEDLLMAARREFMEETGRDVSGKFLPLSPVKQKSGKVIHAWALEGDFDPDQLKSNLFEMPWPPGAGTVKAFPEIDRVAWFNPADALLKLLPAQQAFVKELVLILQQTE